jgi:membrane associated rhomboid family serine protease
MFQSSKTIKQLFYLNIAIFILGMILEAVSVPFYQTFALYPQRGFMLHQLITHQFLHGGIFHLAFNMLALVSIGPRVEDYFGRKRFIIFYLLCGLGAAFLHMSMINSSVPMVGASGAIYGVLLVFAILNPEEKLYFFGIIGLKAKYLVSILFGVEILLGFFSQGDGIGHFAHIGGGLTGILLLYVNKYFPEKRKRRWT